MLAVVPISLSNAINTKLDEAFIGCPEAEKERDILYSQLLEYFDVHGIIPDFELRKK